MVECYLEAETRSRAELVKALINDLEVGAR
jgi:hypothetical protein